MLNIHGDVSEVCSTPISCSSVLILLVIEVDLVTFQQLLLLPASVCLLPFYFGIV
jgi:hypothetical protein